MRIFQLRRCVVDMLVMYAYTCYIFHIYIYIVAGSAVDEFITKLVPLLEEGDIIIDGGNSEYKDTQRRTKDLASKGILFVGSGVSGGEEGARYGPSLMPGGNPKAWPHIKNIFQVTMFSRILGCVIVLNALICFVVL